MSNKFLLLQQTKLEQSKINIKLLEKTKNDIEKMYLNNINFKLGRSSTTAVFYLPMILDTGSILEVFIDFKREQNKIKLSNNHFFELDEFIKSKEKNYLNKKLKRDFEVEKKKFLFQRNINDDIYFSKTLTLDCDLTKEIFDYAVGFKLFFNAVYNVLIHRLDKYYKEYTFTQAINKVIEKFELPKEEEIKVCDVYKIKEDYLVSANDKEHLAFILYGLQKNKNKYKESHLLIENKKISTKFLDGLENDFRELRVKPYSLKVDIEEIEEKVKELLV